MQIREFEEYEKKYKEVMEGFRKLISKMKRSDFLFSFADHKKIFTSLDQNTGILSKKLEQKYFSGQMIFKNLSDPNNPVSMKKLSEVKNFTTAVLALLETAEYFSE